MMLDRRAEEDQVRRGLAGLVAGLGRGRYQIFEYG